MRLRNAIPDCSMWRFPNVFCHANSQERVNTCNWLLGREERLPHADLPPWQYPRVELSPRRQKLWFWGTLVALPAFFLFLGQMVLLVRRYR